MDTYFEPTPENVRATLSDTSKKLYDCLLQELRNCGWDGKFSLPRKKGNSFNFELPTIYGSKIRFLIGLSDLTSKSRSKKGFKCDIDLRAFIKHGKLEIAEDLAKKLWLEAGYRGKGDGANFGQKKLPQSSIKLWDKKLTHRPEYGWDDFTDKKEDSEHLRNLLKIIKDISSSTINE